MCPRPVEQFKGIDIFSWIVTMFVECFPGPCGKPLEAVILFIIQAEVVGKLTPYNELFEELLLGFDVFAATLRLQGCPLWSQLAEVQVGGEVRLAAFCRVVP
jgi:hypothetical protein